MRRLQKDAEKYVSRRNLLLHKKEDCTKNIRDLGVLPEEAFEKYKSTASEKVKQSIIYISHSNFQVHFYVAHTFFHMLIAFTFCHLPTSSC